MLTPVQKTSSAFYLTIRLKPSFFCHFCLDSQNLRSKKVFDKKKSLLKFMAQILHFLFFFENNDFSGTL